MNIFGLSYIFYNYIYNLGDEIGKEWIVIKVGGLIVKFVGRMFIFENVIDVEWNGIVVFCVNGDIIFWVIFKNNIVFI